MRSYQNDIETIEIIFSIILSIVIICIALLFRETIRFFETQQSLMIKHIANLNAHDNTLQFKEGLQQISSPTSPTSKNALEQSKAGNQFFPSTRSKMLKEKSKIQVAFNAHNISFVSLVSSKIFCTYFYPFGLFKNAYQTPKFVLPRKLVLFLFLLILFYLFSGIIFIAQIQSADTSDFSANNIAQMDLPFTFLSLLLHLSLCRVLSTMLNNGLVHVQKHIVLARLDADPEYKSQATYRYSIKNNSLNNQNNQNLSQLSGGKIKQNYNFDQNDLTLKISAAESTSKRNDILYLSLSVILSVIYSLAMYCLYFGVDVAGGFKNTIFHFLICVLFDLVLRFLFCVSVLTVTLCYMKSNNKDLGNRVAREFDAEYEEERDIAIAYQIAQYQDQLFVYELNHDEQAQQNVKLNIQQAMQLGQLKQQGGGNQQYNQFSILHNQTGFDMGKDWVLPEDINISPGLNENLKQNNNANDNKLPINESHVQLSQNRKIVSPQQQNVEDIQEESEVDQRFSPQNMNRTVANNNQYNMLNSANKDHALNEISLSRIHQNQDNSRSYVKEQLDQELNQMSAQEQNNYNSKLSNLQQNDIGIQGNEDFMDNGNELDEMQSNQDYYNENQAMSKKQSIQQQQHQQSQIINDSQYSNKYNQSYQNNQQYKPSNQLIDQQEDYNSMGSEFDYADMPNRRIQKVNYQF